MITQSRREFLHRSARTAGAFALFSAKGHVALLARTLDELQETRDTEAIMRSHGDDGHRVTRVLVAYASISGSTVEVASEIGERISRLGYNTETRCVKTVKTIHEYDVVVLGSPIIYENWMPEVRKFVKTHGDVLQSKQVAYFMTCLALSSQEEAAMEQAVEYSDKLCRMVPEIRPVSIGYFGGVLDYSKLSFVNRVLLKAALRKRQVKEGDYRDWGAIHEWADQLNNQIS